MGAVESAALCRCLRQTQGFGRMAAGRGTDAKEKPSDQERTGSERARAWEEEHPQCHEIQRSRERCARLDPRQSISPTNQLGLIYANLTDSMSAKSVLIEPVAMWSVCIWFKNCNIKTVGSKSLRPLVKILLFSNLFFLQSSNMHYTTVKNSKKHLK